MSAINPTTGQPFEPLHAEYAQAQTPERGDYTVTNRLGDPVHLTSAMLAEHFTWAMGCAHTDPQGPESNHARTNRP